MSVMFTHAMIASDSSDKQYKFILNALHPFDQMKFVLEQAIYREYLKECCGESSIIIKDLAKTIESYYRSLPNKISGRDIPLNTLYADGMGVLGKLFDNFYLVEDEVRTIWRIFSHAPMQEYYNSLYSSTMTHNFLVQWCLIRCASSFLNKEYPENKIYECALYIPQVKLHKGADTEQVLPDNHVVIELAPKSMESLDLTDTYTVQLNNLRKLISRFDMRRYTLDDLIGILASFSIDHSKYVMTNRGELGYNSIPDVCYDLVTGSSFVFLDSAGKNRIPDLDNWLRTFKEMILNGKLKTTQDNELFGEFLSKIGARADLINYFTKPITQISATEAYAFRSSTFADYISDRLFAGTESLEESEPSEKKVLPEIDPNKMLLELASPSETMSDYIYRETVANRISMILRNPPENAMPNDLLMLKRWRSRWLYLASISCLRDFLTRVSLRLSM